MASIQRAAILVREGIDYAQSEAVFKAARGRAGLRAPPERRGGVDRLTVEEELRFLDQAYALDGRTGLMLQTLLETGVRASELVALSGHPTDGHALGGSPTDSTALVQTSGTHASAILA